MFDLKELKRWTFFSIVVLLSMATFSAFADWSPTKPVRLVVPYGPGGNADLSARAFATSVAADKLIDQNIVVENRAGAGGVIATQFVQRAAADGYTLLLARIGSQVVAPALDPATPYKWNDLTPIGLIEIDPYVCVVKANSPIKSFKDLLEMAKAQPGKLSYASTSNMDTTVVFPTKAFLDAGLPVDSALKVPYKGGGDAMTAVLGGAVDFGCNALAPYLGGLKAGTLRALVVSTPNRIPDLPDTPTVSEIGMKPLEMVSGWNALYGPPGLPKEIVEFWGGVLAKLKQSSAWQATVKTRGTIPSIKSPQETEAFVREQFTAYKSLSDVIGPNK